MGSKTDMWNMDSKNLLSDKSTISFWWVEMGGENLISEKWQESDLRERNSKNLFSTDKQIGLPCTLFNDDEYWAV